MDEEWPTRLEDLHRDDRVGVTQVDEIDGAARGLGKARGVVEASGRIQSIASLGGAMGADRAAQSTEKVMSPTGVDPMSRFQVAAISASLSARL